ncbi:hypothetical protein [Pseudomonas nunensis]|uniref:hypothetical protein n=1 Tax=Pseudomonas nunensis TaxID=2961896 RepID=UPI0025AF5303|nr:hypothetical protein [Pseudomonas nunensis]MDN3219535.1 hypothetical protein [Pseudomonas nunensis]
MNAVSAIKGELKQVNSFIAKIVRNGSVTDFDAKYFTLELTDYPGFEGRTWTLRAVHTERVSEDKIVNKTITIIVPYDAESGDFPISGTTKEIYVDYVDTSDSEPFIHVAEKGAVILILERRGDEVSTICGKLDVTVSSYGEPSFLISGDLYYSI